LNGEKIAEKHIGTSQRQRTGRPSFREEWREAKKEENYVVRGEEKWEEEDGFGEGLWHA